MIPISKPKIGKGALANVQECFETNQIAQGRFIPLFEERFAAYANSKHAVATSNGTMALFVALRALGVEDGEVIVPTLTFGATADAVLMAGATPIFVDVDPVRMHLTARTVAGRISQKTKAIIVVDLYGIPAPISPLREFGLPIIKDAAESLGADIEHGDITCFSFFANKVMTTGEGGMCVTNDDHLAAAMRMLRNHGRKIGYWHERRGTNARLTNIQAAIGVSQLEDLPELLKARHENFSLYRKYLPMLDGLGTVADPIAPWFFIITVPAMLQTAMIERLKVCGIDARAGFKPLHRIPAYLQDVNLPIADEICDTVIMLPVYPGLQESEICQVCTVIGG